MERRRELVIRNAQIAALQQALALQFESDLARKAEAELALSWPETSPKASKQIVSAVLANRVDFGISAPAEIQRLVIIISRHFGDFGGRPPLPKQALTILYRKTGNAQAKLDALERLGEQVRKQRNEARNGN